MNQVKPPRHVQAPRGHDDEEVQEQMPRLVRTARDQKPNRGGGKRQAQEVQRIAQPRVPIAEDELAHPPRAAFGPPLVDPPALPDAIAPGGD
jgi:hypothetical protein